MTESKPLPCDYCPRAEEVHKQKDATMFIMCVVKVPGETPKIVTTPTYTSTPCGVDKLIDMIPGCAVALQRELQSPKDAHDQPARPATAVSTPAV